MVLVARVPEGPDALRCDRLRGRAVASSARASPSSPGSARRPTRYPVRRPRAPAAAETSAAAFWETLGDTTLNRLVAQGLEANLDIHAAAARVRGARAERTLAKLDLVPTITVAGGYTRQRLANASFSVIGAALPGSGPLGRRGRGVLGDRRLRTAAAKPAGPERPRSGRRRRICARCRSCSRRSWRARTSICEARRASSRWPSATPRTSGGVSR